MVVGTALMIFKLLVTVFTLITTCFWEGNMQAIPS